MDSVLKTSATAKNLMRAFAGESQARNRYTFSASVAKKEGLPVIEKVFLYTAEQEKEHAEVFSHHSPCILPYFLPRSVMDPSGS